MKNEVNLNLLFSGLKYISKTNLLKSALNSPNLTKCVSEFKLRLINCLDSTCIPQDSGISVQFLINIANLLYDLKACDRKICYHLSKSFEQRSIIASQLQCNNFYPIRSIYIIPFYYLVPPGHLIYRIYS